MFMLAFYIVSIYLFVSGIAGLIGVLFEPQVDMTAYHKGMEVYNRIKETGKF